MFNMDNTYQSDATNKYIWIGSVFGSLIILIALFIILRYWLKRNSKSKKSQFNPALDSYNTSDGSIMVENLNRVSNIRNSYINNNLAYNSSEPNRFSQISNYNRDISPLPKAHVQPGSPLN